MNLMLYLQDPMEKEKLAQLVQNAVRMIRDWVILNLAVERILESVYILSSLISSIVLIVLIRALLTKIALKRLMEIVFSRQSRGAL